MNFDLWQELFETHCIGFGLDMINIYNLQTTKQQLLLIGLAMHESIVKSRIYSTLSTSLLQMVLKTKKIVYGLWHSLETLFRDNKESEAHQLETELRNIAMGDSSVSIYCARSKKIVDQLENLGAPVSVRNLVSHLLSGLSSKFSYIAITICHTEPFPSFMKARSMLAVEEQELMHD